MNLIKKYWKLLLSIAIPIVVAGITLLILTALLQHPKTAIAHVSGTSSTTKSTETKTTATSDNSIPTPVPGLQLDTNKKYGDKYASGILPVGDNKYLTDSQKVGYVYTCTTQSGQGGAGTRGPWFMNNNTEYDVNKKVAVNGSVSWKGSYSMVISGSNRVITTNDLPINHTTGIFPIASSDPAYLYDRNPNTIKAQTFVYTLVATPTAASSPGCLNGGVIGVMTTGVALFDAFDAGGRDAGAWEVQDSCSGHPQQEGQYHYHSLSKCITDINIQTVIGYAIDGYPITGPTIASGNVLTTNDLDECHGIVSQINLDGKLMTSYHYVMTQDFPYSISCYHGTATTAPGAVKGQGLPPKA
ncbi:YHYH protein [Patescibacteria group bacterium]|nr:MAG: YHYH protein [Patescibacteria group bacterium]